MQFKYGGTEIKQYIFPLLSYGIIVYGSNFFDKKYYVKAVSVLLIAFCSIFVVIAFTDQIMPFLEKDYLGCEEKDIDINTLKSYLYALLTSISSNISSHSSSSSSSAASMASSSSS